MTAEPDSYTPRTVSLPACPGCGEPIPHGSIASSCSRCLQGRISTAPAPAPAATTSAIVNATTRKVKSADVEAATRALLLAIGLDPRSDRLDPVPALIADLCVRLIDGPTDA